jgi:hypothetical protein
MVPGQGSSNDSLHKPIPKRDNIYPGFDPNTNTLNEVSSEGFVNAYPKLIQWIAQNNLEAYLNDTNNVLIQRKDRLANQIDKSKEEIISSLYNAKRAQAFQDYYTLYVTNWKNSNIEVYQHYNLKIPRMVHLSYNNNNKLIAKEHNKNADKNTETLEVFHQKSKDFITHRFEQSFEHWQQPYNYKTGKQEEPSLNCMEARLKKIGQDMEIIALINKSTNQLRKDESDNKDVIANIKKFFSTIIQPSSYPAEILPIIDNHQFALAWEEILKYNLVTIDKQFVTITLMRRLLDTVYSSDHKSFSQFYTTFVNNASMYLFREWYQHFTYNEIQKICDTMTDAEFNLTHHDKIQQHALTIPAIVQLACRKTLVLRAVQNTHLQHTVHIYQSSQPKPDEIAPLITALRDADLQTTIKVFHKSTLPHSHNRCAMCSFLKNDIHITNIKLHTVDTSCPTHNTDTLTQYIQNLKHPKPQSQRRRQIDNQYIPNRQIDNSYIPNRQVDTTISHHRPSLSSNASIVSNSSNASRLQPLPSGFNETIECAHCYRSGNAQPQGLYSAERKGIYHNHSSRSCAYNYYKNNKLSNDSANPYKPLVANKAGVIVDNPFYSSQHSDHSDVDTDHRKRRGSFNDDHHWKRGRDSRSSSPARSQPSRSRSPSPE